MAVSDQDVLELISEYENLVTELQVVYYCQDQRAIDVHEKNIILLTEKLGIVWRDGTPQWKVASDEE